MANHELHTIEQSHGQGADAPRTSLALALSPATTTTPASSAARNALRRSRSAIVQQEALVLGFKRRNHVGGKSHARRQVTMVRPDTVSLPFAGRESAEREFRRRRVIGVGKALRVVGLEGRRHRDEITFPVSLEATLAALREAEPAQLLALLLLIPPTAQQQVKHDRADDGEHHFHGSSLHREHA